MNNRMQEFVAKMRDNFTKRLERKTGWGKNEIAMEFERAASESLAAMLEAPTDD